MSNPLDLIRDEKLNQQRNYVKQIKAAQKLEESKQQFGGTVLGGNAETGLVMVQLGNGGGTMPCRSISNGNRKSGERTIVSIQGGIAWLGGMPR